MTSASGTRPGPLERLRRDDGQSVVEATIVLPAMVFLILTMMQLTMLQHARIMSEYAAFCAARAGVVFNGDPKAMERAAAIALLPTYARTDTLQNLTQAAVVKMTREGLVRSTVGLPIARVKVLEPKASVFASVGRHLNGQEIDFDDIRPSAAAANQLQIELDYLYELRIPFANKILQNIFFASRLGTLHLWRGVDMTRPDTFGMDAQQLARAMYTGQGGYAPGIVAATMALKAHYIPIKTTYTMRMQSNFYLKNAP